ncbi:MAG: pentapeptide repeat-containing protein, partial [Cyanobacteriota bacterium]
MTGIPKPRRKPRGWRICRNSESAPIPTELIRPLAERLAKQRPWVSAEEKWLAAESALKQRPWRPFVIRFSGAKERSGWDWADLFLKASIPVVVAAGGWYLSTESNTQQLLTNQSTQRDLVVSDYIKSMQQLVLEKNLLEAGNNEAKAIVARSITLTALSRLSLDKPGFISEHKGQILQFLSESRLVDRKGGIILLHGANLSRSQLKGARLAEVDLSSANLRNANLSEAGLGLALLRQATLVGANLSEAGLVDADLSAADMRWAKLRWTRLNGAILKGADLRYSNLSNARIEGANLEKAFLAEANLSNADLAQANLRDAELYKAQLFQANLQEANLYGANIPQANLSQANLRKANLRATNLAKTNMTGANLEGVNLGQSDLRGSNLKNANRRIIRWAPKTLWPEARSSQQADNIP